jgi:signal transduction histidine kinase
MKTSDIGGWALDRRGKARFAALYFTISLLFSLSMALCWLDELIDLPHLLLGAPSTPVNWQESLIETVMILFIAALVLLTIRRFSRAQAADNAALQSSRSLTAATFSICPDCIWVEDSKTGEVLYANEAFLDFLRDPQGRASLSVSDIVMDKELWGKIRAALEREGSQGNVALHLLGPHSGRAVSGLYSARRIFAEGRSLIVSAWRDVSELERLLANEERMQRLDSLGVVAGGIAHDFNNLLGGIFGYIELAQTRLEANDEEGAIGLMENSMAVLTRAKSLTQQLLTFAKGGAPSFRELPIAEMLRSEVNFALTGSPLRPEFKIEDNLWPLKFDPHQISQVINNLVINALQACPSGGTLDVTAENVELLERRTLPLKPGAYVRIAVRDHGAGIKPADRARVFDPFFTTKKEGTGLGLSICWSIVKRHGGYIDLDSEVGKGTEFSIYLPSCSHAA